MITFDGNNRTKYKLQDQGEYEHMGESVRNALVMKSSDNVGTIIRDLNQGEEACFEVEGKVETMSLKNSIPFGHKFALVNIPTGENIIKYGEIIGRATSDIPAGAHVHVHNVESLRGRGDLEVKS